MLPESSLWVLYNSIARFVISLFQVVYATFVNKGYKRLKQVEYHSSIIVGHEIITL